MHRPFQCTLQARQRLQARRSTKRGRSGERCGAWPSHLVLAGSLAAGIRSLFDARCEASREFFACPGHQVVFDIGPGPPSALLRHSLLRSVVNHHITTCAAGCRGHRGRLRAAARAGADRLTAAIRYSTHTVFTRVCWAAWRTPACCLVPGLGEFVAPFVACRLSN